MNDTLIENFKEILVTSTVLQETVTYPRQDQSHFLTNDFTIEEIELTLEYKRDTSPGFDNISCSRERGQTRINKYIQLNISNLRYSQYM